MDNEVHGVVVENPSQRQGKKIGLITWQSPTFTIVDEERMG
jgi:hypothetical protein